MAKRQIQPSEGNGVPRSGRFPSGKNANKLSDEQRQQLKQRSHDYRPRVSGLRGPLPTAKTLTLHY